MVRLKYCGLSLLAVLVMAGALWYPNRLCGKPVLEPPKDLPTRTFAGARLITKKGEVALQKATLEPQNKVCRTPSAGIVSRVSVQVGEAVQVNDVLMVIEAMNKETVIKSPIAGKVARITLEVGDVVQQGQVLVKFE